MAQYFGQCYCAKIKFQCEGEPFFTQHCHCNKCREIAVESMRQSDKIGYGFCAAYLTSHFKITLGAEELDEVVRGDSKLLLCKTCHCLIYGISLDPSKQAGIGINANNIQFPGQMPDTFKPVRHVYYSNRIIDVNDDLPKFKDVPLEQFGSGELC